MLDFYLIKDDQPKPDYPEQVRLEHISGLGFRTFHNLIIKGIIDDQFNYFSDFRWDKQLIKKLDAKIINRDKSDIDIDQISIILKKAMDSECGVVAFCD